MLRPRRGLGLTSIYVDNDSTNANSNHPKEMYQWGDHLLINYTGGNGYRLSSFADFLTSATYANVGSYTPPAPTLLRMKFAELAKSVYWTTDAGLATLDVAGGTARTAGIRAPEGMVSALTGNPDATGAWLPADNAVGVRACIGFKDANGVPHISAACGRVVVVNPADLTIAIGSLVRDTNVVTATLTAGVTHNFQVGDIVNLTVSGADIGNFDTTNNVVTAITATTVVWAETAANYTNVASVTVTSGDKYLSHSVILPPGMTTSHFVQIYRTDNSGDADVDPGDEMFLIYERYLTSAQISARLAATTDYSPPARLGDPLDSNVNSGEGALGVDLRPPICRDLCAWDGRLWGGQTTDPHRLRMRLLGTGTPDGLQSGDVLCLNTIALVAGTDFTVYTEFLPSQNVRQTLSKLINAMNYTLNTTTIVLRLLMDGDDNETWGAFMLEEDGLGGSALYAGTSRTSAFAEPLAEVIAVTEASTARTLGTTVTVTTAANHNFSTGQSIVLAANALAGEADFPTGVKTSITVTGATTFTYAEAGNNATMSGTPAYFVYAATFKSDNNQQPIRYSRAGIPEAWPLPFSPGTEGGLRGLPEGCEVLRIKPTPDAGELMVFLASGDIYAISGSYPYSVRRVDGSAQLLAADSLVEHSNTLYALTTQGPATISAAGVGIIGNNIEDEWRELAYDIYANTLDWSNVWGLSYESDRQYFFWFPVSGYTAYGAHVYHSLSGQWTRWPSLPFDCGLVFRGADILFMGRTDTNRIYGERKLFGSNLYAAAADGVSSTTANGAQSAGVTTIAVNTTGTALAAGDLIRFDSNYYRVVSASATSIVIDTASTTALSNGETIFYYRAFTPTVTFAIDAQGAPGIEKNHRRLHLHFGRRNFDNMTVTFQAEYSTSTSTVTVSPTDFVMNTPINYPSTISVDVPAACSRASMLLVSLSITEAYSFFDLLGYSLTSEPVSERFGK